MNRSSEAEGEPDKAQSVVIHGDNRGIVSVGNFAFNLLYSDGQFAETPDLTELPLREVPVLPQAGAAVLFGRQAVIDEVTAQLVSGQNAQLFGEPGVGKQAIAWAVNRQLGAQGLRGHVVLPQPSEAQYSLSSLYRRLAGLFFGRAFLREVDESKLREAVSSHHAHITLVDCPLEREDVDRLLRTFAGCTFLLTSRYATLPGPDAAHHVQPLTRAAAVDLLSAEVGLPLGPVGLQNLQFDHVYRQAEGRPQQLRTYAAFIKSADDWQARVTEEPLDRPASPDPAVLNPQQQAEVLAASLSEPARRALVALKTLGVPLGLTALAAITGTQYTADIVRELDDRRLATSVGGALRITAEAAVAVDALGWAGTDAEVAAEGVLRLLDSPQAAAVDADLLLSVAAGLDAAGKWALACRFDKAAALIALTDGRGQIALRLYALGLKAATQVNDHENLEYYVRTEQHTRRLLHGDLIAAGAAIAVLGGQAAHATTAKRAGRTGRYIVKALQTKVGMIVGAAVIATAGTAVAAAMTSSGDNGRAAACDAADESWEATVTLGENNYQQIESDLDKAASKTSDANLRIELQTVARDWRTMQADGPTSEGYDNIRKDGEPIQRFCSS